MGRMVAMVLLVAACGDGGLADGQVIKCNELVGWQTSNVACWLDDQHTKPCNTPIIDKANGKTGCLESMVTLTDGGVVFSPDCTWRTCKANITPPDAGP